MTRNLRLSESEWNRINARKAERTGTLAKPRQAATFARRRNYSRELAIQIRDAGMQIPIMEWAFDSQLEGSGRGWRADLAFLPQKLLVEVDGGAHCVKRQFKSDLDKSQAALKLGYLVLRVSPAQVRDGSALAFVKDALR